MIAWHVNLAFSSMLISSLNLVIINFSIFVQVTLLDLMNWLVGKKAPNSTFTLCWDSTFSKEREILLLSRIWFLCNYYGNVSMSQHKIFTVVFNGKML